MNLLCGLKMLIVVTMAVAIGGGGVFAMDAGASPADEERPVAVGAGQVEWAETSLGGNMFCSPGYCGPPPDQDVIAFYDEARHLLGGLGPYRIGNGAGLAWSTAGFKRKS